MNPEIQKYIAEQRQTGVLDSEIMVQLKNSGWDESIVNQNFREVGNNKIIENSNQETLKEPNIYSKSLYYWWLVPIFLVGFLPSIVLQIINSGLTSYTPYGFHPLFVPFLFEIRWYDLGFISAAIIVLVIVFNTLGRIKYFQNLNKTFVVIGLLFFSFVWQPLCQGVLYWLSNYYYEGTLELLTPTDNTILSLIGWAPYVISFVCILYFIARYRKGIPPRSAVFSLSLGILCTYLIYIIAGYLQVLNIIWCFLGASCFNGIG